MRERGGGGGGQNLLSKPTNEQWTYKEFFIKFDGTAAVFLQGPHCDVNQEDIGEISGEGEFDFDQACQFLSQRPAAREESRGWKS